MLLTRWLWPGACFSILALVLAISLTHPKREDAGDYLARGTGHFYTRNFDKARYNLTQALRLDPHLLRARYGLGLVALEEKRLTDAEAIFRQVLREDPSHREAAVSLGATLMAEKRFRLAMTEMAPWLAKYPNDSRFLYNMAMSAARQGDRKLAVPLLKRYLAMEPNASDAARIRKWLGE